MILLTVFVKMSSNNFNGFVAITLLKNEHNWKLFCLQCINTRFQASSFFMSLISRIKQFITEFEKSSSTSYNQLHGDTKGATALSSHLNLLSPIFTITVLNQEMQLNIIKLHRKPERSSSSFLNTKTI
jgi:hypothetical protein